MELGLMVEPQVGGSYARLCELAVWAERQGLDAFARSDHYLDMERSAPSTDALTTFGGLAEVTDTIQLVVLVTPLTFRHPAVIAKTATTLDEMTGGRFALGVGITRIYAGAHLPLDVVGGAALGVLASASIGSTRRSPIFTPPSVRTRGSPVSTTGSRRSTFSPVLSTSQSWSAEAG